jgi:hypothetical protein
MAKAELSKLKNDLVTTVTGLAKNGKPVSRHDVIAAYRKTYKNGLSKQAKIALENMALLKILDQIGNRTPVLNEDQIDLFGNRAGLHQCIRVSVNVDGRKQLQLMPLFAATVGQVGEWVLRAPRSIKKIREREIGMMSLYRDMAKIAEPDTSVLDAVKLLAKTKQKLKTESEQQD